MAKPMADLTATCEKASQQLAHEADVMTWSAQVIADQDATIKRLTEALRGDDVLVMKRADR